VLGVRVHFPEASAYANALITPPFEIPAFETSTVGDDGAIQPGPADFNYSTGKTRFEDGYGVLKNVAAIKQISVNVYGLNFPHHLSMILIKSDGTRQEIPIGSLKYEGWAELTWDNPEYIQDVRNRATRIYPDYPQNDTFIKFAGFRVSRDANDVGGDFLTYFQQVKVVYDEAKAETEVPDIDDESEWKIIQNRESELQRNEMRNFGSTELEWMLEQNRRSALNETLPTPAAGAAPAAGGGAAQPAAGGGQPAAAAGGEPAAAGGAAAPAAAGGQ
jgi:hypothetical protein